MGFSFFTKIDNDENKIKKKVQPSITVVDTVQGFKTATMKIH